MSIAEVSAVVSILHFEHHFLSAGAGSEAAHTR